MLDTIELVTFRLARGDAQQFLDANAALGAFLQRQPGFVSRHLAARDDGSFLDVVFWRSHADALAASTRAMAEMGDSEAMQMIDPMSIDMQHARIVQAVAP